MPASLDDILALKKKVSTLKQRAAEAKGALSQTMKRLQTEFGFSTLTEARQELTRLKIKAKETEGKVNVALDAFEEKWKGLL